MKADLDWMSRPFAHRGLHDPAKGIVENTPSAIRAALDHDYGIEVDLRPAACGTVMVFHDDTLDRLTHAKGIMADKSKDELQAITFRDTDDRMMSLQDLLELVDGRVPMLLEIKSSWRDDAAATDKFVTQTVKTLQNYKGPTAVMSFDPAFIRAFRSLAPSIPRGLVSEQYSGLGNEHPFPWYRRLSLRFLLSFPRTRPDFIAYDINALPAIAPMITRLFFRRPLLTWTVRTKDQQLKAQKYCDAMIFETFLPKAPGSISTS